MNDKDYPERMGECLQDYQPSRHDERVIVTDGVIRHSNVLVIVDQQLVFPEFDMHLVLVVRAYSAQQVIAA